MARSLRSLRQVATLRHGHMARRFAPAFRALRVCEHIWLRYKNSIRVVSIPFKILVCRPEDLLWFSIPFLRPTSAHPLREPKNRVLCYSVWAHALYNLHWATDLPQVWSFNIFTFCNIFWCLIVICVDCPDSGKNFGLKCFFLKNSLLAFIPYFRPYSRFLGLIPHFRSYSTTFCCDKLIVDKLIINLIVAIN